MTAPAEHPRARWRTGAGAVVVLVLVALGCAVLVSALAPGGGGERIVEPPVTTTGPAEQVDAVPPAVLVHVLGAVERPGLYSLAEGARVVDAVAAAGGLTEAADPAGVNLARPVADGEQLRVPAVGEAPPVPAGAAAPGDSGGAVNLNTADAAALETLPGIGPAIAGRIIAWREDNGPFRSVDDLLEVPGIGERILEGLRDAATT